MKKIIVALGLILAMVGCKTPMSEVIAPQLAPDISTPNAEEELEAKHRARMTQLEQTVEDELPGMMTFLSQSAGAFVFLNPTSYTISADSAMAVVTLNVTIGGKYAGDLYIIAGYREKTWQVLAATTRTPKDQVPLEERLKGSSK